MRVSSSTLYRASQSDLEVRGSDGRTVAGLAVPFGEAATVTSGVSGEMRTFREVFVRGAFARTIVERGDRVKFLALHDAVNRLPLGRATVLREDDAGLYAEFKVSKTAEGDDALELIRDGTLDALSIGFVPVRHKWLTRNELLERLEVKLMEVSAVPFPAFEGAAIIGVRADGSRLHRMTGREARLRLLQLKAKS
jgi:HK97 family phage prohead protease